MEVKKNLTDKQRQIFDKMYTAQFDAAARKIRDDRAKGLADEQTKAVKELLKNKEVKKMIDAGMTFFALQNKLQSKLDAEGVYVEHKLSYEPYLKYGRRYYGEGYAQAKNVADYQKETERIEARLSEKKDEMRYKIWGADASVDAIKKEIEDFLKDL